MSGVRASTIAVHIRKFYIIYKSIIRFIFLSGIEVRRLARDARMADLKPDLPSFEESILWQGVNTNCASLHLGV